MRRGFTVTVVRATLIALFMSALVIAAPTAHAACDAGANVVQQEACGARGADAIAYRGRATAGPDGTPQWQWITGHWRRTADLPAGSTMWVQPLDDGWMWTWRRATGWRAAPIRSLIVPTGVNQAGADAATDGPYHVRGKFLVDRFGRVVFQHGVNVVWKHPPYLPPSTSSGTPSAASYFDERDAAWLSSQGFNSVRLGVMWAGVEPQINRFDDSYLRRARTMADMLGDHHISVLVDSHQDMYTEAYRGEGFPDWARLDHGIRPLNCCGFPFNAFTPSVTQTWDDYWNDRGLLQQHYATAWGHVAERMAGTRNLIGYELVNEPFPDHTWPTCMLPAGCRGFDNRVLQPAYERSIDHIRAHDTATPVWWEGNIATVAGSANHVGEGAPLRDVDANTVLSFHVYCALGGVVPFLSRADDPTCPPLRRKVFAQQAAAATRNRSALAMTEFGASDDATDTAATAAAADANMTSWYYWQYGGWSDPTGNAREQGIFADDLNRPQSLRMAKARVLIRTYPQAVAGTPIGFGFAPERADRRFWLEYRTDPSIHADTTIFVPRAMHYSNGYRVRVTGPARVVSPANAASLRLRTRGAGVVHVEVVRAGG